jgi:hypothetical protein
MAGARHMGTSMAMGQAVGTLAAIAAGSRRWPSQVPAGEVQTQLLAAAALCRREQAFDASVPA